MREISSIELMIAINELKERLEGGRLRKFYDLGNNSFRFSFYKGTGVQLYCRLLHTFNETSFTEEADEATPFAMGVRKRLQNSILTSIAQYGSDRILVLSFGDREYRLIIEMFGKGNMLIVNAENRIELCYRILKFKDRSMSVGSTYEVPKGTGTTFGNIDENTICDIMASAPQETKIITYLTRTLNIGPLYLEDIISGCGINPKATLANDAEKEHLSKALLGFFKGITHYTARI